MVFVDNYRCDLNVKYNNLIMKGIKFCFLFSVLIFLADFNLQAQSFSWPDNSLWVKKISEGIYQRESSNGVLSEYRFEDGNILYGNNYSDGCFASMDKVAYYNTQNDGRIFFFGTGDNYEGYYCPKTNRYLDSKDYVLAVFVENQLIDGSGNLHLVINDPELPKEVIGFFVFFRY